MTGLASSPKWRYPGADSDEESRRQQTAAGGLDVTTPNVARIYDYMLGGKDNFAADREAGGRVLREIPHSTLACRQNREFLGRVVRDLAGRGIRQFLDVGSGLPTRDNVHQIAQRTGPGARVVYADYDRVVVAHARALLAKGASGVSVIQADLRDPETILAEAGKNLDFSQPVAVLLFAIVHFLTDADKPHEIVRILTRDLAAGSAVAVSHLTGDGTDPARGRAAQEVYQGASAPAVPRSRRDILALFDGLELADPGLTDINLWPARALSPGVPLVFYGGVGFKP